jgi:hypothetical protein
LDAFKVSNDILSTFLLFINDTFQVIILLFDFMKDLIFEADLIGDSLLHLRALVLMILADLEDLFKFGYLLLGGNLEGLGLLSTTVLMIVESTLETQDSLMILAEDHIVLMFAKGNATG